MTNTANIQANLLGYFGVAAFSFAASAFFVMLVRHLSGAAWVLALFACLAVFVALGVSQLHVRKFFRTYGFFAILPSLAAVVLLTSLKPAIFLLLFVLHGLACFFLRPLKNQARIGIELVMLITVLASFVLGPKAAAILGAVAMLMDYALSARFSYFMPFTISTYALIGFAAGSFSSFGIVAVGIGAAIFYNIVTSFFIVAFMGGQLDKCLRFGLTNVALNAVIFMTAAPWLLSILGGK